MTQDETMSEKRYTIEESVKRCLANALYLFVSKTKKEFIDFAKDDILQDIARKEGSKEDADQRVELELFAEKWIDELVGKMTKELFYSFIDVAHDRVRDTSELPDGLTKGYVDVMNAIKVRERMDVASKEGGKA